MASSSKTYIVEHLDDELGDWSALEYQTIAEESAKAGATFCLSSVPSTLNIPQGIREVPGVVIEHRSVEEVYAAAKDRVCLLDPAAKLEMSPSDGEKFDIFLFGGILGTTLAICFATILTV
jgi:ribosome biogenesis SPOUT family RNA methylase Rps3